jgi:hypothetical protein
MIQRADADRLGMSSLTLFRRPRSMKEAAAMGLLPGALMIAFATGLKLDPQSASAFAGKQPESMRVASGNAWNNAQLDQAELSQDGLAEGQARDSEKSSAQLNGSDQSSDR